MVFITSCCEPGIAHSAVGVQGVKLHASVTRPFPLTALQPPLKTVLKIMGFIKTVQALTLGLALLLLHIQ